jgi:hypothetical protein
VVSFYDPWPSLFTIPQKDVVQAFLRSFCREISKPLMGVRFDSNAHEITSPTVLPLKLVSSCKDEQSKGVLCADYCAASIFRFARGMTVTDFMWLTDNMLGRAKAWRCATIGAAELQIKERNKTGSRTASIPDPAQTAESDSYLEDSASDVGDVDSTAESIDIQPLLDEAKRVQKEADEARSEVESRNRRQKAADDRKRKNTAARAKRRETEVQPTERELNRKKRKTDAPATTSVTPATTSVNASASRHRRGKYASRRQGQN